MKVYEPVEAGSSYQFHLADGSEVKVGPSGFSTDDPRLIVELDRCPFVREQTAKKAAKKKPAAKKPAGPAPQEPPAEQPDGDG